MRILFTGASSNTGSDILKRMLELVPDAEVWCIRHQAPVAISDSRVRVIDLDLADPFNAELLPDAIDVVIHVAGVTHAHDPKLYWDVNLRGTMRLAEAARARGCGRFVYISTRCATVGAGDYGESKLAAENELKKQSCNNLLIIRPSEIYGSQESEGIDRLIALARRWHATPLLFGNAAINFAPLFRGDFAMITADEVLRRGTGVRTINLCGPEDLGSRALAQRIAKRYGALRIPIWWPLLALILKIGFRLNLNLAAADQLQRLTCVKTCSANNADRTGKTRFLIDQ